MDKVEHRMQRQPLLVEEEQSEIEVSELPTMHDLSGQRYSWVVRKMLALQRYRHRRLLSIFFMAALAMFSLFAIFRSISIYAPLTTPSTISSQHVADPLSPAFEEYTQLADMVYRGHTGAISSVAWSPDGKLLAAGSRDTSVRVWDSRSGKTLQVYRGHSNAVLAIAWSPGSDRVASVGQDGTAQ